MPSCAPLHTVELCAVAYSLAGLRPSPTSHVRTPLEQNLTQEVKLEKPSLLGSDPDDAPVVVHLLPSVALLAQVLEFSLVYISPTVQWGVRIGDESNFIATLECFVDEPLVARPVPTAYPFLAAGHCPSDVQEVGGEPTARF